MPPQVILGMAIAGSLLTLQMATHAATYSYTDLNPIGFTASYGYGISGGQQVGVGWLATGGFGHALRWSGTPSSAVDLNPSGFYDSYAYGTSGNQQVGYGGGSFNSEHALLWSGTASSVVDLNPSGFYESFGFGISGTQQVGYGSGSGTGNQPHALLWSGTASSVVDLNPSGFVYSYGRGISGSQQVGGGHNGSAGHALLWSGTASSVVDLNPSGFAYSYGFGISGSQQVGGGYNGSAGHALLWSGTASSVVDLGSLLSSDYADSVAYGIDANGNVIGWAFYIPTGQYHAILWTVVHESVVICNDPGQCGAVATYSTGASVTCSPPSGSIFPVGTNIVTCMATNPAATYTFTVTVKDCEPPVVSCLPVQKLSRERSAKSEKDSEREENLDGLFQLLGHDNCDPNPRLYIQDSASGFLAGPFANGDIVKITKKHGRQDSDYAKDAKPARPPTVAHIRLQGSGLLYGVDASGNVGASVLCTVPHL